jgi:hypothetical protein
MKLVKTFSHIDFAATFSCKLREFGIPTYIGTVVISNDNFKYRYQVRPTAYGVWVLLETQYEDALKLRKGRRHKVKNPLSEEEMVRVENLIRSKRRKSFFTLVLGFSTLVILGLMLVLIFASR